MKIYIFGAPGSGKTTIAKRISSELGIPRFDIDEIFWSFEKGERNEQVRKKEIEKISIEKGWIMEGMYRDDWLKKVLKSADFVFILNISKGLIYWRIIKRTFSRMLGLEKYERESSFKVLFGLIKMTKNFNKDRLPEFLLLTEKAGKKPIFIKNSKEVLRNLSLDQPNILSNL